MKAAYVGKYGPPEVVTVREVARPEPGARQILVRQQACTVSPADCAMRAADPFLVRLFTGLTKPSQPIPGGCISGIVETVGAKVTRFKPGDRVFGTTDPKPGAMAEFAVVDEDGALALLPEGASFSDAAGLSYSFLTAMPFLRDEAKLAPGQKVLIIGAAGSVGIAAVQLAHNMGAHVTAVCSTHNVDLVRALGADEVIDRTVSDFTRARGVYDVVFDTVGKSSFAAARGPLKPEGIYLTTVPSLAIMREMMLGRKTGQRAKLATTGLRKTEAKRADIALLAAMIERGELRAVTDRIYPLERVAEAHAYVDTGHKAGDVVISFA